MVLKLFVDFVFTRVNSKIKLNLLYQFNEILNVACQIWIWNCILFLIKLPSRRALNLIICLFRTVLYKQVNLAL